MTKGEMIELVYLGVQGGQPSPDVNVRREDIATYLAPAINYVTTGEIRARRREEAQFGWLSGPVVDNDFLGTYYLDVLYDDQRGLRYAELPVKIVSLPSNDGLNLVAPMQGSTPFIKLRSQFEDAGSEGMFINQTRYWYERVGMSDRIYFKNISNVVAQVMTRLVVSIEDLGDDDQVPVPSGVEVQILDLVIAWFTKQRQMPADMLNNNKDDKQ